MSQPSGEILLGNSRVAWTAAQVGEESPVRNLTGSTGLYVVRLYQVEMTVEQGRLEKTTQSLYLAGWRQVRKIQRDMPFKN